MLICKNINQLAKELNEASLTTAGEIEDFLSSHLEHWQSPNYELVGVDGKTYTLPAEVAKYLREVRQQVQQLQFRCRELRAELGRKT